MTKIVKRVLIGITIVLACALCAIVALIGLYIYATRPISDGDRLGGGALTAVVTGHYGPIRRLAYLFELPEGALGLVDTGDDPAATNIETALRKLGKTRASVRAILVTHGHGDHAGALSAFPGAVIYGLAPDIESLRRRRANSGAVGQTETVTDGEQLNLLGTPAEVFALPGHTAGSAAYLVHGVLFLGDAAHSLRDGTFWVNEMFSEDGPANVRSVKSLVERLKPRQKDIHQVAFGHSGPLDGPVALLTWASSQ